MRDKLDRHEGRVHTLTDYYLRDIAISLRGLAAQKEPLPSAPEGPRCAGCFGGRCDECPTDEAGYAVKVEEAKYPAGYLASKYFCSNPDHDEGGGSWNED